MIKIHETSIVDPKATIGDGTRVWQFCNIMGGSTIGGNCNIGQNVFVESGVVVGNNCKIKNNIALYDGVVCEDDVFLGPNCVFTNVRTPRAFIEKKDQFEKTVIHKGASIGANVTIVCGNEVGRYAMVGAGAVVTHDVGDYELWIGNPAEFAGYVCRCGECLMQSNEEDDGKHFQCHICGREYKIRGNRLDMI